MHVDQTIASAPPVGLNGYSPAPVESPGAPQGRRTLPEVVLVPAVHNSITVGLDVLSASASVAIALHWTVSTGHPAYTGWLAWWYVPILIGLLAGAHQYRRGLLRNFLDEVNPVEACVALAACVLLAPLVLVTDGVMVNDLIVRCWMCAAVLVPTVRLLRAVVQRYLRRRYGAAAATLVIGDGPIAHKLVDHLKRLPDYAMRPVGLLDDPASASFGQLPGLIHVDVPRLGAPSELPRIVRETGATELIISFSPIPDSELVAVVRVAHHLGMRVWVVPRLFDAVGARARIEHVGGLPLVVLPDVNPGGWQFAIKHGMDRILSFFGLIAISPIFLTLAILVRFSSPGPIFFRQQRVGRNGRPFDCLKFRSMRPASQSDEEFELQTGSAPGGVEGADRRTRIGKIMRQTSLDELPQLINVLRGDMSLVGPRPERPEFVELFEMQIRRYGERHRVKAGVTGWAQVNGLRGQTSIADRAEWDNYYIENWSLWLDLKILALTVLAVFRRGED